MRAVVKTVDVGARHLPGGGACRAGMKRIVKVSFRDISCIQLLGVILHGDFLCP